MESQDLDKLFQEAFEHAEETPNNRVWENIEFELAKQKKVVPFYIRYGTPLSIAATLLLFLGISLRYYQQTTPMPSIDIEERSIVEEDLNIPLKNPISYNKTDKADKTTKKIIITSNISNPLNRAEDKTETKISSSLHTLVSNEDIEIPDKQNIIDTEHFIASVETDVSYIAPSVQDLSNLVKIEDEMQKSLDYSFIKEDVKSSLVTRVLNGITKTILTKNLDRENTKEIEFINDEEGSISLNIFNSIAKK